ncbi:TPA: hypothetical protein ACQJJL_005594, partial [Raoultella ornithinolytica]
KVRFIQQSLNLREDACLFLFFLAMNVKYCLTINPVMWFRFMGEDFNILPAWHVDQSVKYSAR